MKKKRGIYNVYVKLFKALELTAVQSTTLGTQVPWPPWTAALTPEGKQRILKSDTWNGLLSLEQSSPVPLDAAQTTSSATDTVFS